MGGDVFGNSGYAGSIVEGKIVSGRERSLEESTDFTVEMFMGFEGSLLNGFLHRG
jgi:hypothetical protein